MSFIPLLPGARREVVQRGQYAKSHHFDYDRGTPLPTKRELAVDPREHIAPSSFRGTGTLAQASASSILANSGRLEGNVGGVAGAAAVDKYAHLRRAPVAKDFANTAEPLAHLQLTGESRLPSWVEYDRMCLRFSGYFSEAVHASSSENFRVRPILLYYYLEDDSIHIAEPPVHNSGIPQGVFVKRHRVPRDETGAMYEVGDLFVGAQLAIYGRLFRLTDADQFTRQFYEKNGSPLAESEDTPQDPFARRAVPPPTRTHRKLLNPTAAHAEAALGKHMHGGIAATQQFLKNDGKVLRFYAQWRDDKMYGEIHAYILHFFLADDTVEVLEVSQPNSGYGSFPALLKRSKLPIDHTLIKRDVAHVGSRIAEDDPQFAYYSDGHLRVGGTINVYGRELLLCGADAFTKNYYQQKYGLGEEAFPSLNMADPVEEVAAVPAPPHNGWGSEEDSLSSFLFLVPRQPKTDQRKLVELDGILLRFSGQLLLKPGESDAHSRNAARKFIITYFLANDTIQVFEVLERNTGHIAGLYAERARTRNPATGTDFHPRDLFVGARPCINSATFIILDADDFTRKFMADNPTIWNAQLGNVNDDRASLKHTRGQKFVSKASTSSDTLPDRRPF